MKESEFHQIADAMLEQIGEMIDDSGADIDYETIGNVMTLEFEDRSQIVINKQEPMREIWLASKSGGYHLSLQGSQWLCSKTGLELIALVKQECERQAGEEIDWA